MSRSSETTKIAFRNSGPAAGQPLAGKATDMQKNSRKKWMRSSATGMSTNLFQGTRTYRRLFSFATESETRTPTSPDRQPVDDRQPPLGLSLPAGQVTVRETRHTLLRHPPAGRQSSLHGAIALSAQQASARRETRRSWTEASDQRTFAILSRVDPQNKIGRLRYQGASFEADNF